MSLWIPHILIPVKILWDISLSLQCSWGIWSSGMLWCVDEWLCNIPKTDAVKHSRRLRTSTAHYLVHYSNLQLVALPSIDRPSHSTNTWTYDLHVDENVWSLNKYHGSVASDRAFQGMCMDAIWLQYIYNYISHAIHQIASNENNKKPQNCIQHSPRHNIKKITRH